MMQMLTGELEVLLEELCSNQRIQYPTLEQDKEATEFWPPQESQESCQGDGPVKTKNQSYIEKIWEWKSDYLWLFNYTFKKNFKVSLFSVLNYCSNHNILGMS